jgi:hypothetical protein
MKEIFFEDKNNYPMEQAIIKKTYERPTQEPNQTESRLTDEIHDPFSHRNTTGSVRSAITVRGRLRRAQRGYT